MDLIEYIREKLKKEPVIIKKKLTWQEKLEQLDKMNIDELNKLMEELRI